MNNEQEQPMSKFSEETGYSDDPGPNKSLSPPSNLTSALARIVRLEHERDDAEGFLKVLTKQRDEALKQITKFRASIVELEGERDTILQQRNDVEFIANKQQESLRSSQAREKELEKDRERLSIALDTIGFFFAGTEYQHVTDKILRVLAGESMKEASAARSETPEGQS